MGTLLSVVPRCTLYRYVPRSRVFHCCCVLAGANILIVCAVPSLLLKASNNTPYPCPASEARAPVCPTWLTKYLRPLCSWSRVGGNINTFLRCLVLTPDRLLSSPVCQQYTNSILPIRHSSCRYNEQQLIDVTVVRRVRPRAERSCDCEGHRRWKRACRTLFCN